MATEIDLPDGMFDGRASDALAELQNAFRSFRSPGSHANQ